MWEVRRGILVMVFFQAVMLTPWLIILVYRRPRFRFGLGTILVWGFPLTAVVAYILSWDGPLFSRKSVVTDKATALILLEIFCAPIFSLRWLSANPRQTASERSALLPNNPLAHPATAVLQETEK